MHTHTHIYIYIPSNAPGSAADEPRRRGAFGGARPDAGDVTWPRPSHVGHVGCPINQWDIK